jgi:uncharacterized membrane protein YbaN (DUF454 family)
LPLGSGSENREPIAHRSGEESATERVIDSSLRKLIRLSLLAAGCASVLLAVLGVILPLLPTTPFLILAAACFSRSSAHFHQWLLANRWFGPTIQQWQDSRTMSRRSKRQAMLLIVFSFGLTIGLFIHDLWLRTVLVLLGTSLLLVISILPEERSTP